MSNRKYLIILIIIAIMIMTFTFALVNQVLVINGVASISESSWNISFANLSDILVSDNTSVKELTKPIIVNDTTAIKNIDVEFMNGNSEFSYTFDVKNSGTIDAKLHTINFGNLNCYPKYSNSNSAFLEANEVCKYVDVNLTYDDGSLVKPGDLLLNGESKKMRLQVKYNYDLPVSNSIEIEDIVVSINYVQS